jgi:DNA-binding LytR/AlgR family response regulator
MEKIRCAVVDDEPLALGLMASYVKKTPFLELVGAYSSAVQAMQEMPDHPVDLLFLDIQMPELNGLDYSRMVPPQTRVVFTTAFNQYALDGYKVNALDYLLKPISYPDFLQASSKAQEWFKLVQQGQHIQQNVPTQAKEEEIIDSIFVKSDYKLIKIDLKDVLYIEGLKDYVKIYQENTTKPIMTLMSMKSLEEILPKQKFMRVHRSYIVQKDKIRVIEHNRIVFGNTYIPIGDNYKQTFQDFLDKRI